MTSLKLLCGGLLFSAAVLLSESCSTNPTKDCTTDGTCPTVSLCDTCTIPTSCGIACTSTPKCPTCNTVPVNTPSFTCDVSTDQGQNYTTFTGKVMKAWIYKDPNPAITTEYIVLHTQAFDAISAVNDQICISLKKTGTGVSNYSLASGASTVGALAYLPKTGTPYSTYAGNSGTGKCNVTAVNTTDSTLTGTFGSATELVKPYSTSNASSTTTIVIKNGVFKNIKFTNWFKSSTLTAKVDGIAWTPGGVVRAHPGGEPKNANKLVVEAPFKLATGQIQKMVLKLPLNVSTGSSYPLNIQSVSPTGDYNINFTDAAGLGYTLKNPGTNLSVFTSVAHNLKTRVLSSTGSTMTMTAGATTKVITTCNFNVNY